MSAILRPEASGQRGSFKDLFRPPPGRGDFNFWISIGIYVFSTSVYVLLCVWLVPNFPWDVFSGVWFHLHPDCILHHGAYGGHCRPICQSAAGSGSQLYCRGQVFRIPGHRNLVRTHSDSQLRGGYGQFSQIELTGTSIRGIIKSEIVVFPVVMVASLLFSQFIWRLAPIPSSAYPFAQELWHLAGIEHAFDANIHPGGQFPLLSRRSTGFMWWPVWDWVWSRMPF